MVVKTLDMQFIRYMNLFGRITRVQASHCFSYNNMLIFVVPKEFVGMAIGQNNANLEKLGRILNKRIRIVSQPASKTKEDVEEFVKTIISPVEYTSLSISGDTATIAAGREGKARLIGRMRIRQQELQDILNQYFGIKKILII